MKKFVTFLFITIVLSSCTKETAKSAAEVKYCWTFACKVYTTVSPSLQGYPSTTNASVSRCELTEAEAESYRKSQDQVSKTSSSGYNITSTTTCIKTKK